MRKGLSTLIACAVVLLAAGCGSSSSSTGSSASTSSTGSKATSTRTSAAGQLKVATTPKFAQPSSSSPVQSGVVNIAYRDVAIAPDTVRVKVGSTIRWTNYDPIKENVTSEGGPQKFASGHLGEGGSYQITALRPGVIHYESTLHPASVNGTIEVVQ
jgi:plastocyanin